ncbi:MAG: ADP-forming succinate--CoA ligase subunit beta [Acidimicrobiales bacterium]
MDLFEYQGKQYLARYGVPVPSGGVARSVGEAVEQASQTGYPVVIKAQVKVGGRGKAGGVKLARGPSEARQCAADILGADIRGHTVRALWVERAFEVVREYYASFTLDRGAKDHLAMVSARGGMDIEEVAAVDPGAIAREHIDPVQGFSEDDARQLVARAGLDAQAREEASRVLVKLYQCFVEGDADLVEVNPLVLAPDARVVALDAKVTLDDNAVFRHPEWEGFRQAEELDERERRARELGLQYVGLSGFVGIIANGAGLAMSTCDVVNQVGGKPANFLDIGGGASAEVMANALSVVSSDPSVRSIFVNVFGGITRGEDVANGIVAALRQAEIKVPVVVRLDGTNAAEGRELLRSAGTGMLQVSGNMMGAARLAVELAGAGQ